MSNKIYYPEVIRNIPISPTTVEPETKASSNKGYTYKGKNYSQDSIPVDVKFPIKRVAIELLGKTLNTQSKKILGAYTFGVMGAISIGTYESGVSGSIAISPDGIVGKNSSGVTTFSIDGTTGNASFKGDIQAQSVIVGAVIVGNNSVIIDGANKRILVNDGSNDIILLGYQSGGF